MTEPQQVAHIAALPDALRVPCEDGLGAWQAGRLTAAREALERAREIAEQMNNRDGVFHARHLLGCVAFSEKNYEESRALHEEVLGQCRRINFLGGMASSLFDIAMIDEVEGDVRSALAHYREALECFDAGGYPDRAALVRSAVDRLALHATDAHGGSGSSGGTSRRTPLSSSTTFQP